MNIFRTASPAVVFECQRTFGFLPIILQNIDQDSKVFVSTDNSLCQLFHFNAVNQSNDILCEYNVRAASQLASRV